MLFGLRIRAANRSADVGLRHSRGFVLPYVLATIAVLSLIAVLGANALRQSQLNLRKLERFEAAQAAMDAAEVETLYYFLTSTMTSEGLFVGDRSVDELQLVMGTPPDESQLDQARIWKAIGGQRRVSLPAGWTAIIAYQDADGLVSLYAAEPELVARLLDVYGVKPDDARALAAKLADYSDADNVRRFTGGERADYRLARLPPPTNSPLRSLEELGAVMGWSDKPLLTDARLLQLTTFFPTTTSPRLAAIPLPLRKALEADTRRVQFHEDDLFDSVLVTSRFPGPRAQFTLTVASPDRTYGLRRIIETERTGMAPDHPFSRRLLAEQRIAAEEIQRMDLDGVPALVVATPDHDQ